MIQWGLCNDFCPTVNSGDNCDVLKVYPSDSPEDYENFSRQSNKINGQSFYISIHHKIIWWSAKENNWLVSSRHGGNSSCLSFSKYPNVKGVQNCMIESRCVKFQNKCLATKKEKGVLDDSYNQTIFLQFEATSINPCVFPFLYRNTQQNTTKVHKTCTKEEYERFWCATSTYANGYWKTWGYCNKFCQTDFIMNKSENISNKSKNIMGESNSIIDESESITDESKNIMDGSKNVTENFVGEEKRQKLILGVVIGTSLTITSIVIIGIVCICYRLRQNSIQKSQQYSKGTNYRKIYLLQINFLIHLHFTFLKKE